MENIIKLKLFSASAFLDSGANPNPSQLFSGQIYIQLLNT